MSSSWNCKLYILFYFHVQWSQDQINKWKSLAQWKTTLLHWCKSKWGGQSNFMNDYHHRNDNPDNEESFMQHGSEFWTDDPWNHCSKFRKLFYLPMGHLVNFTLAWVALCSQLTLDWVCIELVLGKCTCVFVMHCMYFKISKQSHD